jgi:hypothetical protein
MDLHGLTHICRHPPPPLPARRAPTPAPRGGGSRGDTRGKAVPGAPPHTLDRGRYLHGGWGRRGGGKKPPPLSLYSICADVSLSRAEWHQRSQRNTPRGSLLSMCWHPPPRPASGLLPRPEGRGQSWRYPGKGRTRGASPYTGPWGISSWGVGQTGRGQKAPSPVSAFNMPASPTPPGLRPPPPPRGAGAVVAIPEEGRIQESRPTRWLPLQPLPIHWTVEGISTGGGADGEGAKSPLPCLCIQYAGVSLSRAEGHRRSQRNTPRGSLECTVDNEQ